MGTEDEQVAQVATRGGSHTMAWLAFSVCPVHGPRHSQPDTLLCNSGVCSSCCLGPGSSVKVFRTAQGPPLQTWVRSDNGNNLVGKLPS